MAGTARSSRPSLRATVADALRADILAGALLPGARIPAADLQAAYDVSGSAVREALGQLAVDGLVVSEDRRGFRVAAASIADLHDIATVRMEIESYALRDAIRHGDKAWEATIVGALHRLNQTPPVAGAALNPEWFAEHRAFHDALVAASPSVWMRRFRATMHDQFERYCRMCASLNSRSNRARSEHIALVSAALARDPERAVKILHDHIWNTVRACVRAGIGEEVAASSPTRARRAARPKRATQATRRRA